MSSSAEVLCLSELLATNVPTNFVNWHKLYCRSSECNEVPLIWRSSCEENTDMISRQRGPLKRPSFSYLFIYLFAPLASSFVVIIVVIIASIVVIIVVIMNEA